MTTLNILVNDLGDEGVTLEEFTRESLAQMEGLAVDVWDKPLFRQAGKRMSFQAPIGPSLMKIFQAWTVKQGKAYIITFTSPANLHDDFRDQVEQMINTMILTKPLDVIKRPTDKLFFANFEDKTHLFRIR